VSVIRVELDVTDPAVRRRVERQWGAVFRLRRAIQRDAAARCRAYWAAHHERVQDPTMLRERLGLSRKGTEAAAKAHIEASGWMRDHLTKAVGSHVADEVWQTMDRHLFADSSGRRHGPPRIGSWWDFTRIAGRARSHTKASPVWKPIGWSAPWMGTWQRTDTRVCPTRWPRRRRPPTCQREPRCWPSRPTSRRRCGPRRGRGPIMMGRWRWCSPACRVGISCCQCDRPKALASGRTCVISWPATIWWPLLSKQHPAHLRTDQARLDVAEPAEQTSTPSCSAPHDLLRIT
jgi:hypothetical protein